MAAREAALARAAAALGVDASANGGEKLAERPPSSRRAAASSTPGSPQLEARERAVEERERIPPDPDAARLAEIEARLDELRDAEEAFLRTRRELADRSDAVDARERLVAQRERELDEREDGWGSDDMRELETRLRKLETQRSSVEQTQELQRRLPQARAGRHPPPTEQLTATASTLAAPGR